VTQFPLAPIIELRNVSVTFPGTQKSQDIAVLDDFSLCIQTEEIDQDAHGHFVVLLGPSGSGKSTILSLIAGLILPDQGEVVVYDEKVTGPHQFSATVQQAYTCFPWLTVLQNVEFGLRLDGKSQEEISRLGRSSLCTAEAVIRRDAAASGAGANLGDEEADCADG
jgi:ABC-type nitrate/sulfonate/bicarbonate transport system ATPase subunit